MSPAQLNLRLQGLGVSGEIVIGPAHLIERREVMMIKRQIPRDKIAQEKNRFLEAIKTAGNQLAEIKSRLAGKDLRDHSYILDVHRMMLEDRTLVEETASIIESEQVNAEWALQQNVERLKQIFSTIDDAYLRERGSDIDYVANRVLRNLAGAGTHRFTGPEKGSVVVAHDLSPVEVAQLDRHKIAGFLTDVGGRTSHTAIMARSLKIAAVVGLGRITSEVKGGELVILDGSSGDVIVDPSEENLSLYILRERAYKVRANSLREERALPAQTLDGKRIRLEANIEISEEAALLREYGAEGIGLYRTEFLFLNRTDFPSEEEHFRAYQRIAEAVAPYPTTLRTLDLAGDKFVSELGLSEQENPAMGLRAIRFCLRKVNVFKSQLKGILRAAAKGNLRILLPMISGVDEIRQTRAIIRATTLELESEGKEFSADIAVGVMIEVPSVCLIAEMIVKEADFLSIGTNDLIQYALAVDRVNEHVSYLYDPLHPSVLRLIKMVVDAANRAGVPVSMCGEMAGEPLFVPILLGLGLDSLSMSAASIPLVKKIIRRVAYREALGLLDHALKIETAREIEAMLLKYMQERFPEEFGDRKPKL